MNEKQEKRSANALLLSNVMAGLELSIVATALPSMMATLHGIKYMSWVVSIYMLLMAVMAPIWTKLAERFGYKRIFILGTLMFVIGSLVEGLSFNMAMVIFARALMGLGAGAMVQLPYVIYGLVFEADRRRKIMGNAISAFSIASVLGPLVGGIIVSVLNWRWCFFINIPIGLFMIWVITRNFTLPTKAQKEKIDFAGSFFLSIATIILMLAFQWMGDVTVNWALVVGMIAISVILYLLFVIVEKYASDPVVPLELFKNRSYMMKNGVMFLVYGFFGFYQNYLPTWGQGVMGQTALIGGLILIPAAILLMIGARSANFSIKKIGERSTTTLGVILMILGAAGLLLAPETSSVALLFIAGGVMGLGTGLINTTLTVAVQEAVDVKIIGSATALNSLLRTLGTALVLSGLSVALNRTFENGINADHRITSNLLNTISDSTAVKSIPSTLIHPLRHILFNGLHTLVLIGLILLVIAVFINLMDPWKKVAGK